MPNVMINLVKFCITRTQANFDCYLKIFIAKGTYGPIFSFASGEVSQGSDVAYRRMLLICWGEKKNIFE